MIKETGLRLLILLLTAIGLSLLCAIIIYVLNSIDSIENKRGSMIGVAGGVLLFFIPLIISSYFFRNRPLINQCVLSFLIIVAEILIFISVLYMVRINAIFVARLVIIAIGGTALPALYNYMKKLITPRVYKGK
jgi:hypothetical protein